MATRVALESGIISFTEYWQTFFAYFESFCAARDCSEDVVAVHGAQDELRAVPDL